MLRVRTPDFPEMSNKQLEEDPFGSEHKQITEDFEATVVKVHDGDTITLQTKFREFDFPLRFLNIDARELNEGGEVAGDWLRERILNENVLIKINRGNRVGKYGRLLGEVIYRGLNMGEVMLGLNLVFPFGRRREGEIPKFGSFLPSIS